MSAHRVKLKRPRLYITLTEVLVVLTLLSLILGFVGINVREAMIQQRFRSEVEELASVLKQAQDLMLVAERDVSVHFSEEYDRNGIEYWLEIEGEVIDKQPYKRFDAIHYLGFPFENKLQLYFRAKGSLMSRGILTLSTHEDPFDSAALKAAICLRGYPAFIESQIIHQKILPNQPWIDCQEMADDSFDQRLIQLTVQECQEGV